MKNSTCLPTLLLASVTLAAPGLGQVPIMLPEVPVSIPPPGYGWGWDRADSVAIGGDGRFIVAWSSPLGPNGGGPLRRSYDAFGNPVGLPLRVASWAGGGLSDVSRDASGRYVIVWEGSDHRVWGRRFNADGTPLSDDFQVNTSSTPSGSPHIASDPEGNFVVAWTAGDAAGSEAIARLFDSHGMPRGDEFPVNAFTSGHHGAGGAGMAADGHFVVWWGGDGAVGEGTFARIFDSSGAPTTGDIQVNTASTRDMSIDAAGQMVFVWNDLIANGIVGRRFDSAGVPTGPVFPISDPGTYAPEAGVSSNSAGNFLVTWGYGNISARFYDPSGAAVGPEFQVNQGGCCSLYHWTEGARVSVADDGSFVVAWSSAYYANLNDVRYDVNARKSGVRASPWIEMDPAGNGVFEPGETQVLRTAWVNDTASSVELSGAASRFSGAAGADYTLVDGTAYYGAIPPGQSSSCLVGTNCYSVSVSAPTARPVQHWDAQLQEALNIGVPKTWEIHIGESFLDVPTAHPFYASIETLFHNGITDGCFGGGYCPASPVTRAQMAVFLLKSKYGSAHIPPPCAGAVFADVPCTGGAFDPWIDELAALGITSGCGGGLYCPDQAVTRQQMAVFLLKTRLGSTYTPPPCTGIFGDVTCTPGAGFSDWVEDIYDRQISGGCKASPLLYCPTSPNNRGQMAAFLTKTFNLGLYGGW